MKVFIGGLGLEAIRLSHIVEADLAVDAYEEMPANLVLDAGLQAEIEVLDLVLAVEFAIRIVVYVISVVRYTETEHRTKAESPSVNMILGQDRDIQENKIIRVCPILRRTEKVFRILADINPRHKRPMLREVIVQTIAQFHGHTSLTLSPLTVNQQTASWENPLTAAINSSAEIIIFFIQKFILIIP